MIVAAHQPQYLPWLGYFHKMAACDLFIYLDDVQFKKREFQNRNKIRVKDGELWLTVPVLSKGKYDQLISEVRIEKGAGWAKDHWTAIQLAYKKAPHFPEHAAWLENFYAQDWNALAPLCLALNEFHRKAFDIKTPVRLSSEFGVAAAKSQRLADLCKAVKADTYLSGAGARAYLDEKIFADAGIRVVYQDFHHPAYKQMHEPFMSHMAALDLILNEGPRAAAVLQQ